ncbi:MAG TPA: thioredoxin [Clostridiaceae bacterium]|nr:thioredoxin [Clostridiaceae bacterium]
MASDKVINLTEQNFDKEVLKSDIPVLVDFWAQWCGPCRAIAPIIDQLADDYEGRVKICKVNVDEENELASRYRVMSIPTILIFKGGQLVKSTVGGRPKAEFDALLNSVL